MLDNLYKGSKTLKIPTSDISWYVLAADDGIPQRLLALNETIICGARMHIEAWRVVRDENDTQRHWFNDEDMQRLWRVFSNGDGDFETTSLDGYSGEWVIMATPVVS